MKKANMIILTVISVLALIVWFSCNPFNQDKISNNTSLNVFDETDAVKASTTLHVTPNGSSSAGGTSFSDAINLTTALSRVVAGDTILMQSGTYPIAYSSGNKNTITMSKSGSSGNTIRMEGSGGQAVIDFQFPTNAWVQDSYGLYVTGSYWYFKNITVTRAGYQGAYVTGGNNTFDTCRFNSNRNTGLEINKGGNNTLVLNCQSNNNFDLKNNGEMADGYGPKQTQGTGNRFIGCSATGNSDDGYDCFDSDKVVTFENCSALNSGSPAGNGQGFKLGGNNKVARHTLLNCTSSNNKVNGYDSNSNPGPIVLTNCGGSGNGHDLFHGDGLVIQ